MRATDRIHYMDNLRALAMLAGVVFHAALAYSPLLYRYWPTADTSGSAMIDVLAWFLHAFRMPLFFVVAGFFAALLVQRRGMAGLFRNRLQRVLLPLVVFLPVVSISMHWLTAEVVATVVHPSPVLAWLRSYLDTHGNLPSAPGWSYLWFLFYLFLFTVLVWVTSSLEFWRVTHWLAKLPPIVLALIMPWIMALALSGTTVPWPAPESFLPSLWALVFFGLYFALGYQLFAHNNWLERLQPYALLLLCGATGSYAVLFWVSNGFAVAQPTPLQRTLHVVLEAFVGCWMTLWCLLAGKRWLDTGNSVMRWLADSSYWVYLVHFPVLLAVQYRLLDMQMAWPLAFVISLSITLALSFASYQVLVRHTVVGRMLNGKPKMLRGTT